MYVIGIDIGGTSIKGAAVDENGKMLDTFSMPISNKNPAEYTLNELILIIKEYLDKHQLKDVIGIGVGIPGILETTKGIVSFSNNLKWEDVPIVDILSKALNLPVRITNDANAAALGEVVFGAGKLYETCILLTIGTGIGGGIVLNGKLFEGNEGKGAELGHIVMQRNGRQCTCGRKGCFETYASATGLIRTAKEMLEGHEESILWEIVEHNLDNMTARKVFDAAHKDDELALKIVDRYVEDLSEGILNYCNIFRPNAVLLSGGIAEQGDYLFDKIRKYVLEHDYGYPRTPEVKIIAASLGYDSGKIGAAALFYSK